MIGRTVIDRREHVLSSGLFMLKIPIIMVIIMDAIVDCSQNHPNITMKIFIIVNQAKDYSTVFFTDLLIS